jgi:hypothetical protein
MRTVARLLLLILVAIAVPVQGALAVTVGQCRSFDHHAADSGHPLASHHEAEKQTSHGHDHGDSSGRAGIPEQGGGESAISDESAPAASGCAPCSACCASPAISGPVQPLLAQDAASLPDPQADVRRVSFRPSRLDRPPLAL